MAKKIISIICPLFYGNRYIDGLLKMIEKCNDKLEKTFALEIIFVNDSPDEQVNVNAKYYSYDVKLINNEKNSGIHKSRVNGFLKSKGDYILFLDQDDVLYENYLLDQMLEIKEADLVISNGIWRKNKKIYLDYDEQIKKVSFLSLFPYIVSPGQVIIKRESIPQFWLENIQINNGCDDALLWNLLVINKVKVSVNNKVGYCHVEEGDNFSCNYQKMYISLVEMFKLLEGYKKVNELWREKIEITKKNKLFQYSQYSKLDELFKKCEDNKIEIKEKFSSCVEQKIAIYGYGYFGQKLYNLCKQKDINVQYVIDVDKEKYCDVEISIYSMDDELPSVDTIVITPILYYDEIKGKLKNKIECNILRIDELLK